MYTPIETYYDILGVTPEANLAEIKHAFRIKAKELHPDRNNSPNAHEEFILLTEAYECLINIKTGKAKAHTPIMTYAEWQQQRREEARERARQYARMKYDEFQKSDLYKKSQALLTIAEHFYVFSCLLILSSPVVGYIIGGFTGLFIGLFFTFITVHYWARLFTEKNKVNLKSLLYSITVILKTKTFYYIIVTAINLFLLFRFTLNTQIPTFWLLFAILILYALTFLAFCLKTPLLKALSKATLFIVLVPGIFNMFFLMNFIFSTNPVIEKYSFVHHKEWYGGRFSKMHMERTSYIHLENNKYEDYHWFRVFFDFDSMRSKTEITYTFEDGLFGLRVLKRYEFTQ